MTRIIIEETQVENGQTILDAGCGVGGIAFEIARSYPSATVLGINITPFQLQVANRFNHAGGLENLHYFMASFDGIALTADSVDRLIFCESFCHSQRHLTTLRDALRVLRLGGKVVLTDVFLSDRKLTDEQQGWVRDYQSGWYVPELATLGEFEVLLHELGFDEIRKTDLTINTAPSTIRLGEHAALRFGEQHPAPEIITQSRRACVGLMNLVKSGKAKYILATFQKKKGI